MSGLSEKFIKLDHIAIAVKDLDSATRHYQNVLGFKLLEQRVTKGRNTSMKSSVMGIGENSPFTIVLMQGCEENSQISRFIAEFGYGIQHVAINVDDLDAVSAGLTAQGVEWATDLIDGGKLRQIFTRRCPSSGVMYEFVERRDECSTFDDKNVNDLFGQLEDSEAF